jgi:oxygen-independent coproporphyrinogen-3 oxidase
MANIYIHYPFCKKACHYCNFHFSTNLENQTEIFKAIEIEIDLRSNEIQEPIESIYFGGGSPSVLSSKVLNKILNKILKKFKLKKKLEITLEVNPDDCSEKYLNEINVIGINRISLGIQSFDQFDLELINRNHNSSQAISSLTLVSKIYKNFSLDLIYGLPYSNIEKWQKNLNFALGFNPPHISCYALTIEPKTVLSYKVAHKEIALPSEDLVKKQYEFLVERLENEGFKNYEFSNFCKQGFHSVNNSNYWNGKSYLGIGPSAHSYDGKFKRSWNISNNNKYLKSILNGELPLESEMLTTKDLFNESIMTGLRKENGISKVFIESKFGNIFKKHLIRHAEKHILNNSMYWDGDNLKIRKEFKFLTDGLVSDLFLINF